MSDMEEAQIRLRTLGGLEATRNGAEVLTGRRKLLGLLAYLDARGPEALRREEVADAFWGDSGEEKARRSLRQAIHHLRAELGEIIVADDEHLGLRRDRVRSDARDLEEAVREGRPESAPIDRGPEYLRGAHDIGSAPFRFWLDAEQARIRSLFAAACEGRVTEALARGDAEAAASAAEQWTRGLPLDEAGHASLLAALARAGRTDEALAHHAAFLERYRAELGADPGEGIMDAAEALRKGGLRDGGPGTVGLANERVRTEVIGKKSSPGQARPVEARRSSRGKGPGAAALFSPNLIGRDPLLEELSRLWEDVRGGRPGVRFLSGATGVGKSRLLEEFQSRVAGGASGDTAPRGDAVRPLLLQARALPSTRSSDWSTLEMLLRGLAEAPGLGGAPDDELARVASLVPGIRDRFRTLPSGERDDPISMGAALARVLADVAVETPILIALDDLPDADTATVLTLTEVVRRAPKGVLILLVTDPVEADPDLAGLLRLEHVEERSLRPLNRAGLSELLKSMFAADPRTHEQVLSHVERASGGNPLLAVALVAALADRGDLHPDPDGRWRLRAELDPKSPELVEGVAAALEPRLATLPAPARMILEALAVLGAPSAPDLVREVAGLGSAGFRDALDRVLSRRLVRRTPIGEGVEGIDLAHGLLRQVVYDRLNPARRQDLHANAVRALESRADREPLIAAALPHHRRHAGGGGREKGGRRWRLAAGIAAIVTAGVAVLALWPDGAPPPSPTDTLAVFTFGQTGPSDGAWLGEGAADLLTAGLEGLGELRTIDRHAVVAALAGGPSGPPEASEVARGLGAGRFVLGTVVESGGRIHLQATLYGTDGGAPATVETSPLPAASLFEGVDELVRGLVPYLVSDPSPARAEVASRTTGSIPALRAFLEGESAFRGGRYDRALDAYARALAADSLFGLAHQRRALALEWGGTATPAEMRESLDRARLHGDRLPSRDRQLLEAVHRYHAGETVQAESALRTLLASEPEFVDGWYALGEVLFHGAPRVGRSGALNEAREVFERVIEMNPDHSEAMLHLVRLSALAGDRTAAVWQIEALRTSPLRDSPVLLPSEVMVGWMIGDSVEMERLQDRLERAPPIPGFVAAAFVATYGGDPEGAARVLESLVGSGRPASVRAASHLWRAGFLAAASSDPRAVAQELDAGRALSSVLGTHYEALHLAHPDRRATPDTARIARWLDEWPPSERDVDQGLGLEIPGVTGHPGLERVLELYLEGLLRAQVGEVEAAGRLLESLRTESAPDPQTDQLQRSLAAGLEAELHLGAGRFDDAIRALGGVHFETWHQAAFSSPFFALARERYLMAVALDRAGRSREALEWYRSVGVATPHDALYRSTAEERARTLTESVRP